MTKEQEIEEILNNYNNVKTDRAKKINVAEYRLIHNQIDFNELYMDTFFANKSFAESKEKLAFDQLVKKVEEDPSLENIFSERYIKIILKDPFHEYKHEE